MPEIPDVYIRQKSLQECYQLAEQLYRSHEMEIAAARVAAGGNEHGIRDTLKQFDDATLLHYWGHGVSRGPNLQRIYAAISILEHNAIIGDPGQLSGGGPWEAILDGAFLVISRNGDDMIVREPQLHKPVRIDLGKDPRSHQDRIALKIRFGALVVNGSYTSLIPDLQRLYPAATILKPDELPNYIRDQEKPLTPKLSLDPSRTL